MKQIFVQAEAILSAQPKAIYDAIADYEHGHPNIVPPENFFDMRVEQGGYGAGTIIRFKVKALGVVTELHGRISEPEPGRVLVEEYINSPQNMVTTFTVIPLEDNQRARVIISTVMNPRSGLTGLVERILIPRINGYIYRKELRRLEAFAQKSTTAASSQASNAPLLNK